MARGEGSVVVRIFGEVRDLVGKLREGSSEVGRFATSSRNVITKSFSDATSIITSRFGRMGGEAQKAFDRIGAKAATSGDAMALGVGAGVAVAAAGIADLAAKGVKSFVDLTSQVRSFQRVSGATAEDSSRMVAVLKILGVDADTGARGLFMLAKNVENAKQKIHDAGIEVAHNRNGSVDLLQTLLNVGDAYKKAGGGAAGAAIAQAAFGRSGLAMLPILAQSREQIEGFWKSAEGHGDIFNQADLEKGRQFQIALKELDAAVGGLERSLGEGLVPELTQTAQGLSHVIDLANKVTRPLGGVAGLIKEFVNQATGGVFGALGLFSKKNKDVADSADEAAAGVGDLTDSLDSQPSAADAASSALGAYNKELQGVIDSVLGIPTALDDVDQAFSDLQDNSQTATTKAADAQTKLADAIESANRRIRDAEQEVSDAREDLNKQASGDRTDARRRVRDAEERLADAHADSAKSIAEAKTNSDNLGGSIKSAKDRAIELDREMGNVVDKVEKTVEEMIKNKRPASEVLAYIVSQRDRLGEVGTKIGVAKTQLALYLGVLTQVYDTTKSIADLVGANAWMVNTSQTPAQQGAATLDKAKRTASLITGGDVPTIIQQFYGPTDPAEQQRQAAKAFNTGLRRRG